MILPDTDGFIVAAQKLLENHNIVYLHNAEGEIVAYLTIPTRSGDSSLWLNHDHFEPGQDPPWEMPE